MKKAIWITIVCSLGAVGYGLFWLPVHLTLSEPYRYNQASDNMVYFWTAKRHKSFFKVGQTYQLEAAGKKVQLELFSITYASLKPDEMKLGFYPSENKALELAAERYRVEGFRLASETLTLF